jgi:hypothetical protein
VSFSYAARRKAVLFFVLAAEAILSFFVYVSLSAHILWPEKSKAATGVANVLSYEGRLMDASGNPLGGTGEPYCFRFSIYDAQSGGTKLWPTGTPATTTATTTDGVFNALVGQADTLDYNFYTSDTTYLNVDVYTATSTNGTNCFSGSWETLSPRQRIAATGYARSAENVYSSLLRTDVSNSRTQIGSGVGGGSPIMFGLDVKNTNDYVGQSCTTSGTLWYNSAISKALVCENGVIQTVSNSGATTTIAAINANAGTPATTGTIVFSNSNNVSFGINGNTITASVNGGGGTVSQYPILPTQWTYSGIPYTGSSGAGGNSSLTTASAMIFPMALNGAVSYNEVRVPLLLSVTSASTNSNWSFTGGASLALYTKNAGTLSLLSSFTNEFRATYGSAANSTQASATYQFSYGQGAQTQSSSNSTNNAAGNLWTIVSGTKYWPMLNGYDNSLSAGQYFAALIVSYRTSSVAWAHLSSYGNMSVANSTALQLGYATASTRNMFPLMGVASMVLSSDQRVLNSYATANITQSSNNASFVNRSAYVMLNYRS